MKKPEPVAPEIPTGQVRKYFVLAGLLISVSIAGNWIATGFWTESLFVLAPALWAVRFLFKIVRCWHHY